MSDPKICKTCGTEIPWRSKRRMFCSIECKSKFYKNDSYKAQQERGKTRRKELIDLHGGKCSMCGYNKNYASFVFHHLNPNEKEMGLDMRILSNTNWDRILEESKKCILICHNCHNELHHPEFERLD